MLEVEIKARVSDPDKIRRKLLNLEFKFKEKIHQIDYYYNHPCKDFKKTDEALRVRFSKGECTLTYKGRKIDNITKSREEITVKVDGDILTLLKRLGFTFVEKIEKVREIYEKDDLKICIDRVKELGCFVEIESKRYDVKKLFEVAKEIGVNEFIRESYLEMFLRIRRSL